MALPRFAKLDPTKKATIIAVATEEFARQGYEKASLNRIIVRCGMSRGTLYYYFADKEDLYETVIRDFSRAILDLWSGDAEGGGEAFSGARTSAAYWEEWVAHYRRSIRYYLQNPVVAELLWRSIRKRASGTSHPVLNEVADQMREWVRQALIRGERIGAVRTDLPQGLLLDTAFSMLEGFARWLARGWSESSEDRIDEHARLVSDFLRRIAEPLPARSAGRKNG
jgi:AcrR family transcriptional regulator